jgi:hypothetical protein
MKRVFLLFTLVFSTIIMFAQEKSPFLIVRGDDIGSSHIANQACIDSYTEGIMQTVEIMVPCPWFEEAVKMLSENPGLDVGIHLVLTSEWENYKWRPITCAPSLTDEDGYFYPMIWQQDDMPPGTALRQADWKIGEIEQEWRAQIELAREKIPWVSHLTCHMGCYNWNEDVQALWYELASEYGLKIVPSDYQVEKMPGWKGANGFEEKRDKFIENLKNLESGIIYLFIEHPAYDTPEMESIGHSGYYSAGKDRDVVTRVFTDSKVKAAIEKYNIQLISYKDLQENFETKGP